MHKRQGQPCSHICVVTDEVVTFVIVVCLMDFNCTAVSAADNSLRVRCGWDNDWERTVPLADMNCQAAVVRI